MFNGDFEIPPYQREDTWEQARKSRFIESLLMGLPIPFLFFWESPSTGKLEIVDGSQRLRTIKQFVLEDFRLGELESLTELEGFRFKDLPEARQRKVKNRSVRGIVLNEHADAQARFDLFDRINTGSKVANQAEVRRGAAVGPFLDLVIKLAGDIQFQKLAPVSDSQNKLREREELITRFFAYSDGLENYKDRVSDFLFAYARKMNILMGERPEMIEQYSARFTDIMTFVRRVFPFGFKRGKKGTVTPRARFEAIAIGSVEALRQKPELREMALDVNWLSSEGFVDNVSSDGANAIARLRGRIEYVRDKLLEQ